jgi:hypothetical protein
MKVAMKTRVLFQDVAIVELEGENVLEIKNLSNSHAEYRVIGFDHPEIKIIDYRVQGLLAIKEALEKQDPTHFPELFCFPSAVTVSENEEDKKIIIELKDCDKNLHPRFMLWVAIGIQEPIPFYSFPFFKLAALQKGTFAFVSLFNYQHFQKYFDSADSDILPAHVQI